MGLRDSQITNFGNGVTNVNDTSIFQALKQLVPQRYHTYYEDFDYFTAADWTITGAGAGTQALGDVEGGALVLTTAALDNDAEFLVKSDSFRFQPGVPVYFSAKAQVDDAVESDIILGITDIAGIAPTAGVFFRKDDGDALMDVFLIGLGGTVSALGIGTIVTNEFFVVDFYWDGISRVYYGFNGAPLGFLDNGGTNFPLGTLTISMGIQAGDANARALTVDYLVAMQERNNVTEP